MDKYLQHGNTSTYNHCLMVAYYSFYISNRLPIRFNTRSIVRGAMLHDFYLYDWHMPEEGHRLHGFRHPSFALKNASKHFSLNSIEKDIIEKHMWPMTITRIPKYKEALLVSIIDKICSLAETFYMVKIPQDLMKVQNYTDKEVRKPHLDKSFNI